MDVYRKETFLWPSQLVLCHVIIWQQLLIRLILGCDILITNVKSISHFAQCC